MRKVSPTDPDERTPVLEISDMMLTIGLSTASALGALWFLNRPERQKGSETSVLFEPISLLFDGGVLQHGTKRALTQLALQPGTHVWDDMRDGLLRQFPEIPECAGAGEYGTLTLQPTDRHSADQLQITWRDQLCWVELACITPRTNNLISPSDTTELINLRRASASLPNPVWQEDASGKVFWFNDAYAALYKMTHGKRVDPHKRLFSAGDENAPKRVSLRSQDIEQPDWYELSVISIEGITIFHATCINAVIAAEKAQRNFVQTLAKTFAHLPIGLVIFDRNGQLALFNPALVDLTGLPPHFLSARPTMLSFFDQLRENRRMPEPKNYLNWRQEIADVIAAATDGRYQETWSLESGQTYSVKGRPHPDGATAFLIEDISAEVTLTRNFRAELEMSQSLLDTLDDGLAVFSSSGILTFSNTAYCDLWQQEPKSTFSDVTIADSIAVWQSRSEDNPLWQKAEAFVAAHEDREAWDMPVILNNGRLLTCRLIPIASGATLMRFRMQSKAHKRSFGLAHTTSE